MAMEGRAGRQDEPTKASIYRDLFALALAFFLIYSAYLALEGLQSSVNNDGSLGVLAVSLVYTGYFVSVIYSPFEVEILGTKITLLAAFFTHTVYVVSNFYAKWFTLLPAALLLGLVAGAPQWTAQTVIVSRLAAQYAQLTKADPDETLSKFTGLFGSFLFISALPGSIVSSLLLSSGNANATDQYSNATSPIKCGSYFCPGSSSPAGSNDTSGGASGVTASSLYVVIGIYLGVNLTGVLVTVLFVKNVKPSPEEKAQRGSNKAMFKDLFRLLVNPTLLCILIVVMFYAFSNSLFLAIFTNSFISCTLGVTMVGYGYACYTVGRSLGCIVSGLGQRFIPRGFHFLAVYLFFGGLLAVWLIWTPTSGDIIIMYAMSFGVGFGNGTLDTQTKALIGSLFPLKLSAAYSLRCLGEGLGHAIALVYMGFLCTHIIIYIQIGALGCSVLAYLFIEIQIRRRPKVVRTYIKDAKYEDEKHNLQELKPMK